MKRVLSIILLFVIVILLAGCGPKDAKNDIFNLVEKNYDAILTACMNKDAETLLGINGITNVNIVDGYVLVYCKGAGIAPSSQDYGFYYSEENIPVAVDCNLYILNTALSPTENGYQCTVDGNTFYTEHIKDNIYFYSNAY